MKFDFAALNFETLDVNVNVSPDMFVNVNGITFTKRVLEDMNYPSHVLCQLDPKAKVFAIRVCKSNEPKAFKFSKPRAEQKGTVSIGNKNLLEPVRRCMGDAWKDDKRYKVTGFWVADAKAMCFDLSEGVQEVFRVPATEDSGE